MFTTLKRMLTFSVIGFGFTLVSAILGMLEVAKIPKLSLNYQVMYYGALVSVPAVFLLLIIGLLSLHADLMAQNNVQYQEMAELKKRVDQLEKKANS